MNKYPIAHYKRSASDWLINGGRLIITENECIVKNFFKEVVRFNLSSLRVKRIPDELFYKGLNFSDRYHNYNLYFYPKTANKLYSFFRFQIGT